MSGRKTAVRSVLRVVPPLLCLLWLAFIFSRSLKSADSSSQESGTVLALFRLVFPAISMSFVRKLAHFTEFFILGALLHATVTVFWRNRALPALAAGLTVAVTDELLQLTAPGRSCQPMDMLLDFSGVAAAVLLLWLLLHCIGRRHASRCCDKAPQ